MNWKDVKVERNISGANEVRERIKTIGLTVNEFLVMAQNFGYFAKGCSFHRMNVLLEELEEEYKEYGELVWEGFDYDGNPYSYKY